MRLRSAITVCCVSMIWSVLALGQAPPQRPRVIDRIVMHLEDDIILQSQARTLGAFQRLVEGRAESDDQLLKELVEQWIVQSEATANQYPHPADADVSREVDRLTEHVGGPEAYAAQSKELGISAAEIRQMLAAQIYVEKYLDYKFRPTVQVEPGDIETYYRNELLPELARTKETAPPAADVEDKIRELLTQRKITELASKWLEDTKSRLKIEMAPAGTTR